jgi:pentapeptide MXKDX repeat protein
MKNWFIACALLLVVAVFTVGLVGCGGGSPSQTDKMGDNKMGDNKMGDNKMGSDKMGSDKMSGDKMSGDKMSGDKKGDKTDK